MGCGTSFVKYVLFFCNLLFALCGLAIIGIGVAFKLKLAEITRVLEGKMEVQPILFIIIGSIIFIVAFFGCCGAVRESHCMVVTYAVFLLILIIIQIVLAILIFVYIGDFEKALDEGLKTTFNEAVSGQAISQNAMDALQTQLQCCGVGGPHDYPVLSFPSSCCAEKSSLVPCSVLSSYSVGCSEALRDFTKVAGNSIGAIAIGVAAAEIIGAIFALCLANSIRNADRRSNY